MKGIASAPGSATVVNAIATGRGAAFAIDLRVRAEVNLTTEPGKIVGYVGGTSESPKLIETCVRKVLQKLDANKKYGAKVITSTDVPIAVGLSSSSSAANAVVLATFAALGDEPEPMEAINLGVDAAFEAGTTVTGAFDDASASYLGGGVITDNLERKILRRFQVDPKLRVLIYIPPRKKYTREINRRQVKPIAELVKLAHEMALNGNIFRALTVNGMLYSVAMGYDLTPALEALELGALASGVTGTGPAIVAICKTQKIGEIKKAWAKRPGRIVETRPSLEGARVEK
ncbi:MAG: shikimate kinase [Hadesarchaea archaeon]|nr:shikimate kinase [Hadesarchaea archaeon]